MQKLSVAAALAAAACLAQPVQAQRLSLAERVAKLEQQVNGQGGGAQGSVELVNQIQALQSQVQQLQGQIEELRHQADESRQRSKDQYIDLDSRIGRLEGRTPGAAAPATGAAGEGRNLQDIQLGTPPAGAANAPVGNAPTVTNPAPGTAVAAAANPAMNASAPTAAPETTPPATAPSNPAAEKAAYDDAFNALKDGRYAESARRFQDFTTSYPNSDLTGNAYYWLGESYYVTQNYQVALETFQSLLARFPQTPKAPDALLKVGYCQYELKQWAQAEATLNQVLQKYPDTTVARLAQGRLRALKLETHR